MITYIRTYIVEAEPMTRGEHLKSKGLKLIPGTGSEADEGYFIQYPDGYKSWCPKESFEKSSRPANEMTFGQAVEAMKNGKKVRRAGWNGKGMYIFLASDSIDFHTKADIGPERNVFVNPCVVMFTAQGEFQPGWLASQADMLSEDWQLV